MTPEVKKTCKTVTRQGTKILFRGDDTFVCEWKQKLISIEIVFKLKCFICLFSYLH